MNQLSVPAGILALSAAAFLGFPVAPHGASTSQPKAEGGRSNKELAALLVGPEQAENNCASCHEFEAEAWRKSRHHQGFSDRHRSKRAKEILKNMGQRSMKRGTASNSCAECHYTSTLERDRLQPKWGVSCESCHAPAKDWVDVHNRQFGASEGSVIEWGQGRTESVEAHKARMSAAEGAGMVHSDMLYEVAANCLDCHAVPNEYVVNRGGHRAGSEGFELVAWSQGEVRHNFLSSAGHAEGATNAPSSPERQRRMFIIGCLVDLEYSTRNLLTVEERGAAFHSGMIERIKRLRVTLEGIAEATGRSDLAGLLGLLPKELDTDTQLDPAVPERIGDLARGIQSKLQGVDLSSIDRLLPTEHKGTAHQR